MANVVFFAENNPRYEVTVRTGQQPKHRVLPDPDLDTWGRSCQLNAGAVVEIRDIVEDISSAIRVSFTYCVVGGEEPVWVREKGLERVPTGHPDLLPVGSETTEPY